MIAQIKRLLFILLLGAVSVLHAATFMEPTKTPEIPQSEDVCALSPPAVLMVVQVGTNWADLSWSPVLGASQYHIVTQIVATGTVVSDVMVPATLNGTRVQIPSGVEVQSKIWSVCNNNEQSSNFTGSDNYSGIVIELVINGFSPPSYFNQGNCTNIGYEPDGCVHTWNETNYFKVQYGESVKSYFSLHGYSNVINVDTLKVAKGSQHTFAYPPGGGKEYVLVRYSNVVKARLQVSKDNSPTPHAKVFRVELNSGENDFNHVISNGTPAFRGSTIDRDADANWDTYESELLTASPNPFSDLLDVQIPASTEENDVKLSLYDLQGRLAISQKSLGGPQIRSLSTQDLKPGLYLLRVDMGDRSETIKVVKTQ